jgi:hypothetical protein
MGLRQKEEEDKEEGGREREREREHDGRPKNEQLLEADERVEGARSERSDVVVVHETAWIKVVLEGLSLSGCFTVADCFECSLSSLSLLSLSSLSPLSVSLCFCPYFCLCFRFTALTQLLCVATEQESGF